MKAEAFKYNLQEISRKTVLYAKERTRNRYSENIKYIIQPNILEDSEHLDNFELTNLAERRKELKKVFTLEQVVERLFFLERVPLWINVSIENTTTKETVIELLTSRRFRKDEIMHSNEGFPPFHISIPIPPNIKENERFDINWKNNKLKMKLKNWFNKIK